MKQAKYLLIGGGLASATAAKEIRQADAGGSIVIVGQEPHIPYDRPPLTKKYLQGHTPREKVFLEPAEFYAQHSVEAMTGVSVERLDAARRIATLANGRTIEYQKALLATGGRPRRLNVPGADTAGVYYLRTLDDCDAIIAEAAPGKHAVLVGGGFIALEAGASLTQRGVNVALVERGEHIWGHFADKSLAEFYQTYCTKRGMALHTGQQLAELRSSEGRVSAAVFQSGLTLPCDFVVVAVGIELNLELARQAGLKVDDGVLADEHGRTSDANIYAAGDIMNYPDPHFDTRRRVEHWGQAEYTGGLAGANMAGQERRYDLLTYVFSDVFDLHLEFAGHWAGHDRMLMRGWYEDESFAVLYLKGGQLRAYYAINTPKEVYQALGKLIESRKDLTGREEILQDPDADVRELLQRPGAVLRGARRSNHVAYQRDWSCGPNHGTWLSVSIAR